MSLPKESSRDSDLGHYPNTLDSDLVRERRVTKSTPNATA